MSSKGLQTESAQRSNRYRFTRNWFTPKIPIWEKFIGELRGRPDIHYLEIGVHEGSSFFWVLDNILTHPTSRAVAIDPFLRRYADQFRENLAASGSASRVTLLQGAGELQARKLPDSSFDLIYIDGGHAAKTVFAQAAICWQLLKTGGVLIFDDYHWRKDKWPLDLRPEMVIDTFLTAYSQELELLNRERNVFVRKAKGSGKPTRSKFFKQYIYDWSRQSLSDATKHEEIELEADERMFIEDYLRSLKPSQVKPELSDAMATNPVFIRLQDRLKLDI